MNEEARETLEAVATALDELDERTGGMTRIALVIWNKHTDKEERTNLFLDPASVVFAIRSALKEADAVNGIRMLVKIIRGTEDDV